MIRTLSLLLGVSILGGCGTAGGGSGGNSLNQLDRLPDADGDGFPEIDPPAGIVFNPNETLAMKITNTITRSQAQAAAQVDLPGAIASQIAVSVDASVTLAYEGGVEQVLRGSYPLGPNELVFEVACPESIEILVTAVADTPITTPQAVETFGPFAAVQDEGAEGYPCGAVLEMETSADPVTGELVADVSVQ